KNKVFSIDLVSDDPSVIACDMAHDEKNKMFVLFYFRKKEKSKVAKNIEWPQLKPCLYKRR
uniref:Uncharacterized protein n=2 Tax=Aegilops tauschii subsp. strangulata TaxID=200361 RepID=A0A453NZB7_AEGTS